MDEGKKKLAKEIGVGAAILTVGTIAFLWLTGRGSTTSPGAQPGAHSSGAGPMPGTAAVVPPSSSPVIDVSFFEPTGSSAAPDWATQDVVGRGLDGFALQLTQQAGYLGPHTIGSLPPADVAATVAKIRGMYPGLPVVIVASSNGIITASY